MQGAGDAFLAETLSALHQTEAAVQLQSFCTGREGGGGGILTQRLYSGGMWRSLGLEFM